MDPTHLVGLDFETYASVSLPDVGLMRYVNDPYFEVTLASIARWHGEMTFEFPMKNPDNLNSHLAGYTICAHNAGFERAVLKKMGINIPVIDSAVVAAVAGADRHLAGAARQLMQEDKLDEDRSLLNLFAKMQKDQVDPAFDRDLIDLHPEKWAQYKEYCARDAKLSRGLILDWAGPRDLFEREMAYARITLDMNEAGWPVDVAAVEEMRRRYLENLETIQIEFASNVDPKLNINSHVQVKQWCEKRGIRSRSFDKQNVERLIARLEKLRAQNGGLKPEYEEVLQLLLVKQALGGSSLKKLETILAVQYNGRVYDQYVHAGAAQSLRTSGRSVQMQNLPRLVDQRDMWKLFVPGNEWTNEELANNLRQVFTSSDPRGQLIVADFASIESRALAYLAGETWKVDAYRRGEDVYKAQAMKIFNLHDISQVSKEQRTTGKVGELSCGYGAGGVAVKDFAAKMNVQLTESEANILVRDWRDANPRIVEFWEKLGDALYTAVNEQRPVTVRATHDIDIRFVPARTPASLVDQAPGVLSFYMNVWKGGHLLLSRVFHGCHLVGRDIRYYKPSHLVGGKPWKDRYVDPKTKRQVHYKLYGGKLAGILTQSLCREIFFEALRDISSDIKDLDNVTLVGQFHDEVVIDWVPGATSMNDVIVLLETIMSVSPTHPSLPMGVEVKHDYRYTK